MKNDYIKITFIFLLSLVFFAVYNIKKTSSITTIEPIVPKEIIKEEIKSEPKAQTFETSVVTPSFLTYPQTVEQIKNWEKEANQIVETGIYGKTKKGTDLYYIRINNKEIKEKKPVVLITSAIHGNETWSSGITMAYIGHIINQYNKNKDITNIVNNRDVYFIPVVSPDSYNKSRDVDGVDPNRDFPSPKNPNHKSTPSIASLTDFYWKIRPKAVISGHTFGRLLLIPYGDKYGISEHEKDYTRIVGKMAEMTGYKKIHCSELYNKPIAGTEIDWFYRNGSIAIVLEFGTHQHQPSLTEITSEFKKTKDAISHFINEAPNVAISVADEEIDFSKNTGIAQSYHESSNGDLIPAIQY
jgi:hypothetical protein